MLALFIVAVGVFLLPFAFPTPPPIVTRFQATLLFSPNADGRRDLARVNVRLHEPSAVTIEIRREGARVARLLDGVTRPKGFFSTTWDGRDDAGVPLPDGVYGVKLFARSGEKTFDISRKVTLDTVAPQPAEMSVVSATRADAGPGECRLTFSSRDAGSLVLEARRPEEAKPLRRLGARPVRPGQPVRWAWNGRDATGEQVPPGLYVVGATIADAARNRTVRERTCWVGHLAGTATVSRPAPRDRVGVVLRRTAGAPLPPETPVALTLRRRTGIPGRDLGDPLGPEVGREARGRAGTVRIALPPGTNPRSLWLVARTLDGRAAALIDLGGPG